MIRGDISMGKIIAIDFDGTLCTNSHPNIASSVGLPIWEVINAAKQEKENGAKLILWTCRTDSELEEAIDACKSWGLEFDAINDHLPELKEKYSNDPRKVFADEYWDDKAVKKP